MTTKFKTVVTTAGAAKFAAALTSGGKKVNITSMAVGDGGGKLPEPNASQTKLLNEVWRHALNKISQDNKHKNYVVAELVIPPETGGFWLREMGLYDDTGTLVAVGNMAESYKPKLEEGSGRAQTLRMVIILSDVASIDLSIDATMVMATQDYVDDKLLEHEQSRRHPDASLTEKGFAQLSNATNSASEVLAATPKAVKAAYDLATAKYTAQDATTAQKGLVQLSSATNSTSEVLAATPKAVKETYDLANAKYTAQDASTARKGLVQLSSSTDSDSELLAATPKAVKAANDNANGRVPVGRKVNGRALSGDIVITYDDVGALSSGGGILTGMLNIKTLIPYLALTGTGTDTRNYIMGFKSNGTASWYVGKGNANSESCMLWNYTASNGVELATDGSISAKLTSNKPFSANTYFEVDSSQGAGSYLNQYTAFAPYYNEFSSVSGSEYHPLWKQKDLYNGMAWSGGMLINSGTFVIQYINSAGTQVFFNFGKDGTFSPSSYDNFDARYQAKGSYTPAGQAYTKAESDARYVQNIRLGARTTTPVANNNWSAASGGVITEYNTTGSGIYRLLQRNINGTWVTVSVL
ncbi:phage tail protein [Kosakonia sp. BYX6]|uniref:Phage tail protein n=1 Tax=Kosakonia calanthes TaxID=3139408 RepID=A0ABZ3B6J2_9ENTR